MKKQTAMLVSAAFLALPMAAEAQTTSTTTTSPTASSTTTTTTSSTTTTSTSTAGVTADRLADRYKTLAGSESNADALIKGLRDGTDIKLTSTSGSNTTTSTGTGGTTTSTTTTTTTINPPTSKMGYGNINIALALAEASLKEQGITNPTTEQLKAALNGGTIKTSSGTTTLAGVLQMRADGQGWGQIAQALGFKVGEVVGKADLARAERGEARNEGKQAAKVERASVTARAERPARVERAERPVRPERVERPVRPERPERPERSGR